jgi:hypothetical protein
MKWNEHEEKNLVTYIKEMYIKKNQGGSQTRYEYYTNTSNYFALYYEFEFD